MNTFPVVSRLTDAPLAYVHAAGQAEAQRRGGSSARLLSVTMSDQFAPPWAGICILSRWQLIPLTAESEAAHA